MWQNTLIINSLYVLASRQENQKWLAMPLHHPSRMLLHFFHLNRYLNRYHGSGECLCKVEKSPSLIFKKNYFSKNWCTKIIVNYFANLLIIEPIPKCASVTTFYLHFLPRVHPLQLNNLLFPCLETFGLFFVYLTSGW